MADKPKTDTMMKFELKGKPVFAECTLDVAKGDTMMDGFRPATPGVSTSYSNFFEVHSFDFGMSLKEGDSKENKEVLADSGAFAAWRSAAKDEYKEIKYPLEFDKFTFKRTVDRASPIFFANCCSSTSFDSATLVKRVSAGGPTPLGIMRIDFTTVLLTGVDWSDGELVSESVDFICQKMVITMRTQMASGTISSSKYLITWDSSDDRSLGIRTKYSQGG